MRRYPRSADWTEAARRRPRDRFTVRILIAEDEAVSRRFLETSLRRRGHEVVTARDGVEAWRALEAADAPSFAILDWMMPQLDGLEVCRRVREQAREPYTYLILLTARDQKEDVVEGLRAGADDYLSKPFHADELEARLRAGRRIVELQAEVIAAREALRVQANDDLITGLANRRSIVDALEREVARARRQDTPLAVALIDIDHFKGINDTHGHGVGDSALREVATRLREGLREYDVVGRYGGEEFLAVLPGCSGAIGAHVAERLRARVADGLVKAGALRFPITVSLGVAAGHGAACPTPVALVHAADGALYRAKRGGRNRVETATLDEMAQAVPA